MTTPTPKDPIRIALIEDNPEYRRAMLDAACRTTTHQRPRLVGVVPTHSVLPVGSSICITSVLSLRRI